MNTAVQGDVTHFTVEVQSLGDQLAFFHLFFQNSESLHLFMMLANAWLSQPIVSLSVKAVHHLYGPEWGLTRCFVCGCILCQALWILSEREETGIWWMLSLCAVQTEVNWHNAKPGNYTHINTHLHTSRAKRQVTKYETKYRTTLSNASYHSDVLIDQHCESLANAV